MFRPGQPSFLILPKISMIMYDLFWTKYFLYLNDKGFDFKNNEALSRLLFSPKHGGVKEDDIPGIIAQISIIVNQGGNINTFDRYLSHGPTGWLFQDNNWVISYNEIIKNCINFDYVNAKNIMIGLLGNTFKSNMLNKNIDFIEIFKKIRKDNDDFNLLSIELAKEIDMLITNQNLKGFPVGSNLIFTNNIICDGEINLKNLNHHVLANNQYFSDGYEGLNDKEKDSFFNILYNNNQGQIILASMLIEKYLHDSFGEQHGFYNCYSRIHKSSDDIIKKANINLGYQIDKKLLLKTAFSWDFNMFVYCGEYITRKLFKKYNDELQFSFYDIETFLKEKIESNYTEDCFSHIELFSKNKNEKYFKDYLIRYFDYFKNSGKNQYIKFIKTILETYESPIDLYIRLLAQNENVEVHEDNIFFDNYIYSDPVFTGLDVFFRWRKGLIP